MFKRMIFIVAVFSMTSASPLAARELDTRIRKLAIGLSFNFYF